MPLSLERTVRQKPLCRVKTPGPNKRRQAVRSTKFTDEGAWLRNLVSTDESFRPWRLRKACCVLKGPVAITAATGGFIFSSGGRGGYYSRNIFRVLIAEKS